MIWTAMHSKHWDWVRIMIRIGIFDIWPVEWKTNDSWPGSPQWWSTIRTSGTRRRSRCGPFGCARRSGTVLPTTILLDQMVSPAIDLIYKVSSCSHNLILIHTRAQYHNQARKSCAAADAWRVTCTVLGLEPLLNIRTMLCDNLRPGSRECAD